MKVEISVPEVVEMFKEIQAQPEKLFEMIRVDIRETVGSYLSTLMGMELTHFLIRAPYERTHGEVNHRNGSYDRRFSRALERSRLRSLGIGTVILKPGSSPGANSMRMP